MVAETTDVTTVATMVEVGTGSAAAVNGQKVPQQLLSLPAHLLRLFCSCCNKGVGLGRGGP